MQVALAVLLFASLAIPGFAGSGGTSSPPGTGGSTLPKIKGGVKLTGVVMIEFYESSGTVFNARVFGRLERKPDHHHQPPIINMVFGEIYGLETANIDPQSIFQAADAFGITIEAQIMDLFFNSDYAKKAYLTKLDSHASMDLLSTLPEVPDGFYLSSVFAADIVVTVK